ncbi:MAG: SOS response-associated peptidase [Eubacteriaceae bacterium]|nr:SOS response-associated peptidase [Eubacteriaceae bacterium]
MCGRYNFIWDKEIAEMIRLKERLWDEFPGYEAPQGDIYPSYEMPVLIAGARSAGMAILKWGMESPNKKGMVINARSEGAGGKRMFAENLKQRRCVVFGSGFYEFGSKKEKYLFTDKNPSPIYMAGIYDKFGRFVILTQDADEAVSPVHERMPVLLRFSDIMPYLSDAGRAAAYFGADNVALERRRIS